MLFFWVRINVEILSLKIWVPVAMFRVASKDVKLETYHIFNFHLILLFTSLIFSSGRKESGGVWEEQLLRLLNYGVGLKVRLEEMVHGMRIILSHWFGGWSRNSIVKSLGYAAQEKGWSIMFCFLLHILSCFISKTGMLNLLVSKVFRETFHNTPAPSALSLQLAHLWT